MTDNLYAAPSNEELSNALKKRFCFKNNKYTDGWGCTFYENVYHLLRKPEGAHIPSEHPISIQNNNFMNEIEKNFSDKFNSDNEYGYKVFSNCYLSELEFDKLVDLMYDLFQNNVAEFSSWDRICRYR
jgi:hypothetical protein